MQITECICERQIICHSRQNGNLEIVKKIVKNQIPADEAGFVVVEVGLARRLASNTPVAQVNDR